MSATIPVGRRVLAVASHGGHWEQLMRLSGAWDGLDVVYARASANELGEAEETVLRIPDAARGDRIGLMKLLVAAVRAVRKVRPDYVVTTGAAPGLAILVIGKLLGARTVWVDSLANVERVSLAGRLARPFSDLWLTQWPHLAGPKGPEFVGAVL